jgi:hypothetical protein
MAFLLGCRCFCQDMVFLLGLGLDIVIGSLCQRMESSLVCDIFVGSWRLCLGHVLSVRMWHHSWDVASWLGGYHSVLWFWVCVADFLC